MSTPLIELICVRCKEAFVGVDETHCDPCFDIVTEPMNWAVLRAALVEENPGAEERIADKVVELEALQPPAGVPHLITSPLELLSVGPVMAPILPEWSFMAPGPVITSKPHPAKFSEPVLEEAKRRLEPLARGRLRTGRSTMLLDPFAGVGRVHRLRDVPGMVTVGIELEPEWACQHPDTACGDSLVVMAQMLHDGQRFQVVFTSPVYGNRMSDHHEAKDASKRHTYRHYLERPLTPNNSGQLPWGAPYRSFHTRAWTLAASLLDEGGLFLLNSSDFLRTVGKGDKRRKERIPVTTWHATELAKLGLQFITTVDLETKRMGHGANRDVRVAYEQLLVFTKP